MSTQTLGQLIKQQRTAKGLTQAELGDALGVNQSRISQYERDETIPSKYIVELERVLDLQPRDLLAYVMDLFNDVEKAIVHDQELSRKEQDALLSAYGHLTGRPSFEHATLYRSMGDDWDNRKRNQDEPGD